LETIGSQRRFIMAKAKKSESPRMGLTKQRRAGRRLRGKTVIVTGASSGVGRAIARAFGREGASVALLARGVDGLEAAAREIREAGGRALVLPVDVANAAAVDDAADRVVAEWGAIDIWVNDAMVSVFAPVTAIRPEEFRRVTEVNYLGYVHGTLAALRHMKPRNAGVIVQIGSALAYRSIPLQSAYCASKAAIRGFTDSLRSELIRERSRIAITMVQLPAVNTPQFEVVRNRLSKHPQPVPPIYEPEVIARATLEAVLRPRREVWIAWSTVMAILGQRVIPGFLDRYLAKRAWESQETDRLPPGHPQKHDTDNVDEPIAGDRGAHGPFDRRARAHSTRLWAREHRHWLAPAAIAAFAGLAWSVRVLVRG
jgi:NAD(P)-dependent dehydrogenase (short-subunit alcohol dehydrogenase family)